VVNNREAVFTLLVESNPIPDLSVLDLADVGATAYLATLEQRSSEVTQVDTRREDRKAKRTYWPWPAAAMVLVLVGLAVVLLNQSDDTPAADASPEEVLADYAATRNSGDVDGVMEFYAEDAVVENHPLDDDGIATGTAEIRALEEQVPAIQGSGDGIELIDEVVSGNTVTFDTLFFRRGAEADSDVIQGCLGSKDHQVTVEDGKITLYVHGPESEILCLDWLNSRLAPGT
jgi:ketosteroid isomerase-like protein